QDYRLRWDDVRYEPGELLVVAYKDGKQWANAVTRTAGAPAKLLAAADRQVIRADGKDLGFITVRVTDASGLTAPRANDLIEFRIKGPAEIVATDNGDPTDLTPFPSPRRAAFHGLCLVIVRASRGQPGSIELEASSAG